MLATTLLASFSLFGCGATKKTSASDGNAAVEVEEKATDHEKIKEYIEKADEIVIVKDAKNLDIEKAITSMVTEEQKENVESVVVDDSKVDYTEEGTYPLTITVTVKQESSDQTASTEESTENPKKDAETSSEKEETDSKADATESKDTSSTEEKNNAASTEVIEDTVDVTVAEKDKADDLLEDGSAIIGDDSKVEIKDDKKEESKKEEIKKEEKKEESKKDDTSQKIDAKKEESVKKEDTKNDTATSNKQETAKKDDNASTTKPSGNSSSSSTSNNTSSSKPSGSSSSSNTTKPSGNTNASTTKPTHTHTWVAQTKTVHHDEVGHNEQYETKAAWDEEVPIYEEVPISVCNVCGADCTEDPYGHMEAHLLAYEGGGYRGEWIQKQVGTNIIHHDAEYGTRWVVDKAAWDETVTTGYKCSCGATK